MGEGGSDGRSKAVKEGEKKGVNKYNYMYMYMYMQHTGTSQRHAT